MRTTRPRFERRLSLDPIPANNSYSHDRDTPYAAATSAGERPSTTTAVMTKRALDTRQASKIAVRYVLRDLSGMC